MNISLHRAVITLRAAGLGFGLGVAAALLFAGAWGALVAGSVVSMVAGRVAQRWQPPEDSVDAMLNALGAVMRWWLAGYVGGALVGWFVPGMLGPYGAAGALVAGSLVSMALTLWQLGQFGISSGASDVGVVATRGRGPSAQSVAGTGDSERDRRG